MKKTTLPLLALLALTLTGCVEYTPEEKQIIHEKDILNDLYTVEYKGHSYIVFKSGVNKGGILHNPDCPCREKGGEE